ncbi:MAG: bifunctional UDP-N-acetylglucosamine diphosphorylase/glucosamine-1-phosphate N-acetyltransferase GlmU, partial [Pseudomonadota bacterium]
MKSAKPKVLHQIAGRSMLAHVLSTAAQLRPERLTVVVGPDMEDVAEEARNVFPGAEIALQEERRGTADAVRAALPSMRGFSGALIVLFGDTPLITSQTLQDIRRRIDEGGGVSVLGFQARNPHGYGRLILDDGGNLTAIREDADLAPMERNINLCNSGVMAFNAAGLGALIGGISNNNSKGEYYLTDAVQIAALASIRISVAQCPEDDVMGINDRAQLAVAEAVTQDRLRLRAMSNGATLVAPETVFFSHDTRVGRDVVIEPNVVFGPGVTIEDGVTIRSFCHFEKCLVREFAEVGPYARLRPEADIGDYCKVGNFVEIKKAVMEHGSKVNHLTYIGDARVGARANIGAGTITCNYDGQNKHHTDIGEGAFIGSNSSLVAPVNIGDGAYVGSGSVVTKDVSPDALAVSRARQLEKAGWAARKRGDELPAVAVAAVGETVAETEEAEPQPQREETAVQAESEAASGQQENAQEPEVPVEAEHAAGDETPDEPAEQDEVAEAPVVDEPSEKPGEIEAAEEEPSQETPAEMAGSEPEELAPDEE